MTSRSPQIVAFGGGGFSMESSNTLLDDYVLELAAVERPEDRSSFGAAISLEQSTHAFAVG
jgi:hypothetical protein